MAEDWPLMAFAAAVGTLALALRHIYSDLWSMRHTQLLVYASVGVLMVLFAAVEAIPRGEWMLFGILGGIGLILAAVMGYWLWREL